jgi:hypothetical protein
MSTKTTFKRVALVAVAALGFGMLTTGVSQAANSADVMTLGAVASTGTTTAPVSTTVSITGISDATLAGATATAVLISAPTSSTNAGVLPTFSVTDSQGTANSAANAGAVATSATLLTVTPLAAGRFTGSGTLTVTPDAVGTYVYRITPGGSVFNTTAQTWTVTVAAPTGATAAASRVYMQSTALNGASNEAAGSLYMSGDYTIKPTATGGGSAVLTRSEFLTALTAHIVAEDADTTNNKASLSVSNANTAIGTHWASLGVIVANGTSLATSTISSAAQRTDNYNPSAAFPFTAAGFPVTVSISGPGFVTYAGAIKGKSYTEASADGQINYLQRSFGIVSDGTFGTSTITVSQGGTVLGTRTIVSSGPLASYSVTASKSLIGISESGTLTVAGADSAGNATPAPTVFAVSSNTAVATVSVAANVVTVNGLASGTASINICNTSACTSATVSKAVTVNVTKTTAAKVTITTDKSEYSAGEKIVFTVTALDSNGSGVADLAAGRALLTAVTSTVTLGGNLPSASVVLVDGKATYTAYAPLAAGPVTVTATEGAATDSTTKATVSTTFTVLSDGVAQAAVDAAAEATDAANAATDAANAAAEAADAATAAAQDAADAVAALSTQVAEMIDALKKQITALTNLVIKIQKKVKA